MKLVTIVGARRWWREELHRIYGDGKMDHAIAGLLMNLANRARPG